MTSKFLIKLLSTGFALTIAMSVPALASNLAQVTGDKVNLRSYNSTNGQIVGSVVENETLTIMANANNGWFQIKKNNGATGFISADFIQIVQTDATCIDNDVNVRTSPSTSASILGKASKGNVFVTTGKVGDWYSIKYSNSTGYIHKDFMQGSLLAYLPETSAPNTATTTTATAISTSATGVYGVVDATSLNLRATPSSEGDIIRTLPDGYFLTVGSYENNWIKVTDDEGNTGYVSADYILLKNGEKPENTATKPAKKPQEIISKKVEYDDKSVTGNALVEYSEQFLGTPYVWAGTDLRKGVDCSGFIYSVYGDFGISLQRRSVDMFTQGSYVSQDKLEAGDLVFFNSGGDSEISHVGMYIGDNQYIHSTNGAGNGVVISDLGSDYATKTYVGAKRILN